MEDQRAIESKEIILRSSGKKRMPRKTHQDFRNKSDQGKTCCILERTEVWKMDRLRERSPSFEFDRLSTRGTRETLALPQELSMQPLLSGTVVHNFLLPQQPWFNLCSLNQPDCHISSFLCHIGHYPLPTHTHTHKEIISFSVKWIKWTR